MGPQKIEVLAPEGRECRLSRSDGRCCRLKNTPVRKAADARQNPPSPNTLFYNDWILHFINTARETAIPRHPRALRRALGRPERQRS